VLLQAVIFLLAFVFAPKHGLLASKKKTDDSLNKNRLKPATKSGLNNINSSNNEVDNAIV
jgi:manganese/iron transport system permease protein